MSERELPNYNVLLQEGPSSRPIARKILGLLLRNEKKGKFEEWFHVYEQDNLKKLFPGMSWDKVENKKSKVDSAIDVLLISARVIEKAGKRGPIKLKWRTPLCWLASSPGVPFAYMGLLGQKKYPVSETQTAIELLKSDPNVGVKPEKIVVLTSNEVVGEWEGAISPDIKISWETKSEEMLNDIDKVEEFIKPIIIDLMRDYILIMDLTSGPRPAGIAFYELAVQFKVPLIYVYEPKKRLRWLISKEKLEQEIGGAFCIQPEEKGPHITKIRKRPAIY